MRIRSTTNHLRLGPTDDIEDALAQIAAHGATAEKSGVHVLQKRLSEHGFFVVFE